MAGEHGSKLQFVRIQDRDSILGYVPIKVTSWRRCSIGMQSLKREELEL